MKPFDLYQHFHCFCEMLENDKITIEARLEFGKEWLRSLPASMLCVPYELSQDIIAKAMRGRLDDKEKKYGGVQRKASAETSQTSGGQVEVPSKTETRAEPVRQDATDGGGKTAVEDMDRPKVPKAKRQGAGKA